MDVIEAMKNRHSVRQYELVAIENNILSILQDEINSCNKESGLHIQLIANEPKAFDGLMAHYGKFSGVTNYIALIGPKNEQLDGLCGYYGEKLVLKAQQLGLNTCWVAMTYKKIPGTFEIKSNEKLTVVIALGYGKTNGVAHKSKDMKAVSNICEESPEWFRNGVKAALLAPTAMNQQKFYITYMDGFVSIKPGFGFYSKVDMGIVKYHFELGSKKENVKWK
ncbi:MAG: nitroreductase family protein [Floccifex sp.]